MKDSEQFHRGMLRAPRDIDTVSKVEDSEDAV